MPSNQQQIIEQANLTYSPLGKAFQKQTKEQVKAIKNLNISDKANKVTEGIFPRNVLNNLISKKFKKIIELQNSIELDKLDHKNYDFDKVHYPLYFQEIYTYTKNLSIENADNEQGI